MTAVIPLASGYAHAFQAGVLSSSGNGAVRSTSSFRSVAGAKRLPGRNELVFAWADEICTSHAPERFTQHRPVVGIVPAQECLVQSTYLEPFRDMHSLARACHFVQGVLARVPHCRCH